MDGMARFMDKSEDIIEFTVEVQKDIGVHVLSAVRIGTGSLTKSMIDIHISIGGDIMGLVLEISREPFDGFIEQLLCFFVGIFLFRLSQRKEAVIGTMMFKAEILSPDLKILMKRLSMTSTSFPFFKVTFFGA